MYIIHTYIWIYDIHIYICILQIYKHIGGQLVVVQYKSFIISLPVLYFIELMQLSVGGGGVVLGKYWEGRGGAET